MKKYILYILLIPVILFAQKKEKEVFSIIPVQHASFVIESENVNIFVDPVGSLTTWKKFPKPEIILITHAHGDHCDKKLVAAIADDSTRILGAAVAIDVIGKGEIVKNGESVKIGDINIEVIPAYNTTESKLKFHPKGVGNGYVLSMGGKRIYIAGDTEDIPEMRSLKNIDYAFLPMNEPYTMSVEQAASAVNEFKPKVVYPYHFRGQNGKSDLEKFKNLIDKDNGVKVVILKWYDE